MGEKGPCGLRSLRGMFSPARRSAIVAEKSERGASEVLVDVVVLEKP